MTMCKKEGGTNKRKRRGIEFSKIVLAAVTGLYIVTVIIGICVIVPNPEHVGELFAFVGAPTSVAIGFYAWKAKAENIMKIDKNAGKKIVDDFINEETEGDNNGMD